MADPLLPSRPEERRAAIATWRAVPFSTRRQVIRAARRGERHPDTAAVRAGTDAAAMLFRPRGPGWWQRPRWWSAVGGPFAGALVAGVVAIWLATVGVVRDAWIGAGLAVVLVLYGLFVLDLRADARALVALEPGE